jgi:hypothetical protein
LEGTTSNLRRHELFESIENLRFQEKEEIALGVDKELIDRLLAEYKSPEEVVGLLKQLTKAIVERAFEAELTTYLRYNKPSLVGNTPLIALAFCGKRASHKMAFEIAAQL